MKIQDYLLRFIDKRLWIVLEGSSLSKNEKKEVESALNEIASSLDNVTSTLPNQQFVPNKQYEAGVVLNKHQYLWLLARLYRKFTKNDNILLAKIARFESLLARLNAPDAIAEDLRRLNDAVSNSLSSESKDVVLPQEVAQFLETCLVSGDLDAAVGVIGSLMSPYLSHLPSLDSDLQKINKDAFQFLLNNHSSESANILLHLLAVSSDGQPSALQVCQLVEDNTLQERDVFLSLLSRRENPPAYIKNLCFLKSYDFNDLLDDKCTLLVRQGFLHQMQMNQHWFKGYLGALSKNSLPTVSPESGMNELGPVFLLYLWCGMCRDVPAGTLNYYKFSKGNPVFLRLGNLLQKRDLVMSWIKQQENLNVEAVLNAVFNLLQKYSTLHVLHQSGSLLCSNPTEVENLLERCSEGMTPKDNWEIVTFKGYSIMVQAMNLFYLACKLNGEIKKQLDFEQYQENALNLKEELAKVQQQLKRLYPLNFRLDILENVFSLIFLRYENLKVEEATSDSGGDDEDSLKSLATVTEASLSPDPSMEHQDFPAPAASSKATPVEQPSAKRIRQSGFLCGPLVIKETLSFVKESLIDCSSALYKQKSVGDNEVDPQLQKRISIFNQTVTEAWWRLQLVTDVSDIVDYEKKSKSFIPQPQRGYLSSASSSDSDYSDHQEKQKSRKTSQKSSRSDNTDKSSGSGSNTTGGLGSSSSSKGKKIKRRKSHALSKLPQEADSIVNVLLANPLSLALICLERCDYSKAQQVVQTFQLANSEIANEANFLELFHTLSVEVSKTPGFCTTGNTIRDFALDMSPTNTRMLVSSSLEMVRKAASIGMSAVSVTSLVEKILAVAPVVHGMEKLIIENRQANMILSGINEKTMVSVDAAFSLGLSSGASCSLMDVVSQHANFTSSKPGIKGRSYAQFVTSFMDLFRNLSSKGKCDSAAETLASWDIPLSMPVLNEYLELTCDLNTALIEYFSGTMNAKMRVSIIRQIVNILAGCCSHYESRGIREIGKQVMPYLQHLFWYMQTLSYVLTRCSQDDSKEMPNPFDLLKESWEKILGRLIFDLEAPFSRVERVANRLNLDLLQAIVSACCPTILQFESSSELPCVQQPSATAWAKISLNAATSQQEYHSHSKDLAATILSNLLNALKRSDTILITASDLPILSNKPEIAQILSETTKLSSINLESFEEEDEKTAFLCNLCNLLVLQSLITLGQESGLTSSSWAEKRSAYNCIGYHIGQMGFVSLSGLLRQLVGPDFDNNLEARCGGNLMWNLENKHALFTISQGTIQSPLIQVYEPESLGTQIESAVSNYVMHNVRVEGSIMEGCFSLVITPLILQYLGLSSPSSLDPAVEAQDEESLPSIPQQYMPVTSMARDCVANMSVILEFLEAHVSGQLKLQLADWVEAWQTSNAKSNELIIVVEDSSKKMGVLLQTSMEVFSPDLLKSSISSDHATLAESWENCNLSPRVLQYLGKKCWIVALLVERLRRGTVEYQFWPHTESLDRYLGENFARLSAFGDGNLILAALKPHHVLLNEIWSILDKFIVDQNDDQCIQLMVSLPENLIFQNVRIQTFRDLLLYYAASQSRRHGIEAPHRLALSLGGAELRAQCILKSIQFWSGDDSIEALKAILGDPKLKSGTRKEALNALKKVVIYQKVHKVLCYYQPMKTSLTDGWHQIHCLSESDPGQVLQALIEAKQFRLCLQWADLHGVPSKASHLIDCNLVAPLLDSSDVSNYAAAETLLLSVPTSRAVSICRRLLASLTSVSSLQFVVCFALKSCKGWLEQNVGVWGSLQLWSAGLSILSLQPEHEQIRDRNLASKPYLLIEQMLMNTKLAVLAEALRVLRSSDLSAVPADNASQPSVVDALLRSYANKALDFRIAQRIILPEVITPDPGDLLQSLSTGSTGSGHVPFSMPSVPPTKEEWVPNEEVSECMCCHLVPFSMFNRRHHCRRCGRVVCSSCSNHRTRVDGYSDLQVRTCDDCFMQIKQETLPQINKNAEPSVHSSQQTYIIEWTLSGDEAQDETAREEFSFEHAPSVALCLSILGLHSEHAAAQPRFLLEAAEKMLQMLAPPTPGFVNPELDYSLVIRMARGLVVAAKVRYAKAALNSGVAHCDRLLGQVDLLSLLVKSGCANLLPVEPLPLSGHALRHLRDRLLSAELWSLALEVSTKAGLDRTGVWAAWGKACLRAGKWLEAREHLAHCLQPTISAQESVPAPLLSEIIRILEESSYSAKDTVLKQSESMTSPALSVLHTLSSLTAISQGKLSILSDSSKQPLLYTECQYYLRTYGSPAATISFFLSHSDLVSALRYTQDKSVEPDVFAEALYKPCLVQGLVGQLFQEMNKMDPSLEMWKSTIMHVGRLLEQQGLWNSLYQLQLFARDLIRAAMTCIRFYKTGARCYSDMSSEQLVKARGHIEDELTSHWTTRGLTRSTSVSSTQSSEPPDAADTEFQIPLKMPARTLDHNVNTISRQLEAAKFLQQCEVDDRTSVIAVCSALNKLQALPGHSNLTPTLFGDTNERVLVAALILLCGKNIEEGFGTTFRIIQYFRLKADKVYNLVAQQLVVAGKSRQITQLVNCIQSSGSADAVSCSDRLVVQSIHKLIEQADGLVLAEPLLRLINETEAKIQAHLICGFLKSAYLLAVKSGRISDVKLILNEAEKQNQPAMKRICLQWLAQKERSKSTNLS